MTGGFGRPASRSLCTDYTSSVATIRASFICSLQTGFILGAQASRKDSDLVIGYYDAEPSCWRAPDGEPISVFVELFDRIAQRRGWKVRWSFRPWNELVAGLKSGEIDVVPAIVRGSVMLDWGAAVVRRGASIGTILDLDGRRATCPSISGP